MRFRNNILSCFLIMNGLVTYCQSLEFYREDLDFEIKDRYIIVEGVYYFSNVSNKEIHQALIYPFPVNDSLYGEVDTIAVVDIGGDMKDHIIRKSKNAVLFSINLAAYETIKFRIYYKQKLLKKQAEYILTTTAYWHQPLEQANYILTVPDKIKITSFSYQPDSSMIGENKKFYYWNKKNFMPDKNMVFKFD